MQIDRIYYPVETLGPGKRIGIWTIGCNRGCVNCSNPELWESDPGRDISIDNILNMIGGINKPDGITITGGEPFFQIDDLCELVKGIKSYGINDILIYSGYKIQQLKDMKKPQIDFVLSEIAVLVDGEYIDALNDNVGIRGSSNQVINILNENYMESYKNIDKKERKSQIVISNGLVMSLGIPKTDWS